MEKLRHNGRHCLLADIIPGIDNSDPHAFTFVNGLTYFVAMGLWSTDSYESGTHLVPPPTSGGSGMQYLTAVGTKLFFQAEDGLRKKKLWVLETAFEGISGFTLLNAEEDTELGALNQNRVINL